MKVGLFEYKSRLSEILSFTKLTTVFPGRFTSVEFVRIEPVGAKLPEIFM